MQTKLLQIKTLSSTRVGAGRGLGHIDLPVVRERATNFPYIPGSSIKGVVSDYYNPGKMPQNPTDAEKRKHSLFNAAFGKGGTDADSSAGAFVFTDARLLALPILSFYGTFALVTCPAILRRLQEDLKSFEHTVNWTIPDFPAPSANNPDNSNPIYVETNSTLKKDGNVFLLDVDFNANNTSPNQVHAADIASLSPAFDQERQKRCAIVSDDAFAFLCETGTEVSAHIRIEDETKIVAKGGLWYEETLPAETVLYGFVSCDKVYCKDITPEDLEQAFLLENDDQNHLKPPKYLQFGGKASTGKGRCACVFNSLNQQEGGEQ